MATTQLQKRLKTRHLVMMSLGSAIGAGLFLGVGEGIAVAGPAILLAYVAAGLIIISVMRMLGEMVAADPNPGAFSYYAGKALGPAAAFAVGWLWWVQLCLVVAVEATAAAQIMRSAFFPDVPQWIWVLAFMLIFTVINLMGVGSFGEFEYWFSFIKVAFVILFLIVVAAFLFGLTPGESPGLSNVQGIDLAPSGIGGIGTGLLIVIFAFGGIEILAVAAAETADPETSIRKAIAGIVLRILVFYMGSVTLMILAVRWDNPDLAENPFVTTLTTTGLPAVGAIMAIIIVVALLSSLNANVYGASRMVFSLAHRGMAPAATGRANNRGVPIPAIMVSVLIGFASVLVNAFNQDNVLFIGLNVVGSTLLVTWIATVASHIILRHRAERDGTPLPMKMWGYPVLSWLTAAALLAVIVLGMFAPDTRTQMLWTFGIFAIVWLIGVIVTRGKSVEEVTGGDELAPDEPHAW
ncbi:amino acid permease [Brevibacterium sp. HMSC24B04]|uniref:amino acid permease n=1 Tax=Brevibacterium sp. HMSC24B04 TaxID=1581060 RepID=UPI0008A378EE|nr:amino acid permease [Brevibacterium sp. HMSC24B04]OFT94229.1 amino acid transporter [Brevibacterium sp. HMSC24B04]